MRGAGLIELALWTLIFALAIGGEPWEFPTHARELLLPQTAVTNH